MSKQGSKSRLKVMAKSHTTHFFRQLGRIIKYGVIGFGRNIWLSLTATIVTALTLILLFATIIASIVLNNTADAMREKIDITIYFKPGTTSVELKEMAETMKKDSNVRSVTYSTSEEEAQKLYNSYSEKAQSGDDESSKMLETIKLIGEDRMIDNQPAAMRIKVYDTDNLDSIKNIVNTDEKFAKKRSEDKEPTYDTNSSAISTISSWANIATKGGFALSVIFFVISVLVIFNTIRMAIYSRSEEIYMEKLVGANNSFIRGPFLVEAMISGIFAGIIASIASICAYWAVAPKLESYGISISNVSAFLMEPHNVALVGLALVLIGIIITLVSALLAIHKYLRKL